MVWPSAALVRAEFVSTLRRPQLFNSMAVVVGVSALLILAAWPVEGLPLHSAHGNALATLFLTLIAWFALAFLMLPAMGAAALRDEEGHTISDHIQVTLITPRGYVCAHYLCGLGAFWAFAVGCLPITATLLFTTGLEWGAFLSGFAAIASATLCLAAAGLFASALSQSRPYAIFGGYLTALLCHGLPLFVLQGLASLVRFRTLQDSVQDLMPLFCPLQAVALYAKAGISGHRMAGACLIQLVIAFLLLTLTILILEARSRWRLYDPVQPMPASGKRRKRFSGRTGIRTSAGRPIRDDVNPIYEREQRWDGLARPDAQKTTCGCIVAVCVCLFPFLVAMYAGRAANADILWCLAWFPTAMTALLVPLVLAGALAREYEGQRADLLRMSLIGDRDIVVGKLWAGLHVLWPLAALYLILSLLAVPLTANIPHSFSLLFTWTISAAACGVGALAMTLLASSCAKTSGGALFLAVAFIIIAFGGGYVAAEAAHEVARVILGDQIIPARDATSVVEFKSSAGATSAATGFVLNTLHIGYQEEDQGSFLTLYWASSILLTLAWSWGALHLAMKRFGQGLGSNPKRRTGESTDSQGRE